MEGYCYQDWNIEEWCPELIIEKEQRNKILRKYLRGLNKDEYFILSLNFGLYESQAFSLEDIGIILSVSHKKVRKIKNEAIRKIRDMDKNEDLRDFLSETPKQQIYSSNLRNLYY